MSIRIRVWIKQTLWKIYEGKAKLRMGIQESYASGEVLLQGLEKHLFWSKIFFHCSSGKTGIRVKNCAYCLNAMCLAEKVDDHSTYHLSSAG